MRSGPARCTLAVLLLVALLTPAAAAARPAAVPGALSVPTTPLPAPDMRPVAGAFTPPVLQAEPAPRLRAGAAVLMDWETGEVLHARQPFARRAPASTTKILTALIALERGNPQAVVVVSRRAASTPGSSMHLKAGERYTLHDLLQGLLLRSGNDAAVAIAEHLAGSVEGFAAWMNARSQDLGARQSHWLNPHGLDHPQHYTTAYDLALITRQAMAHPVFAAVVSQRARELSFELLGRQGLLTNTNRLLWSFEGADGVKTGTTSAAGACLVASATRTGQRLIAVVLHSGNRWNDAAALLAHGYQHYQLFRHASAGEVLLAAPVAGGLPPRVDLVPQQDVVAVVRRSGAIPQVTVAVPPLRAPLPEGATVGEAVIYVDGVPRRRIALVAARPVARATPWQWFLAGATELTRGLAPLGGAG